MTMNDNVKQVIY